MLDEEEKSDKQHCFAFPSFPYGPCG
jgi:hypothetical protein